MKLFKFVDTGNGPTYMTHGVPIDGYESAMCVERYREAGEFEITAQLSSGLMNFLPRGTLISHVETYEIYMVEDHQLVETKTDSPKIKITGRSLEAVILENRHIGVNYAASNPTPPPTEFNLAADNIPAQAVSLVAQHIGAAAPALDQVPYIFVVSSIGAGISVVARTLDRQNVHKALLELLAIEDYGVRVVRRNPFGVLGNDSGSQIRLHKGVDRSDNVTFSWHGGDFEEAEYLWSTRTYKNAAYVKGKYVETVVYEGSPTGIDVRYMFVDASDLDERFSTPPAGGDLTDIRTKMQTRGYQALANQQEVSLTRSDISGLTRYRYRKDYDIGDIVSVDGNFGIIEKRRVVEYVEIDDLSGSSGHPTLAEIPPNAVL